MIGMKRFFSATIGFILLADLVFPANVFGQDQSQPAQPSQASASAPYKPFVVVDGIYLSEPEMIHLPEYRTYLIRGFQDQPNLQLVDYDQISKWKSKYTYNEKNVHDSYLTKARDRLAKGKKHYEQLEFPEALTELSDSRKEFIVNLSHLRSNRDLLEAHLYLGMTYIALSSSLKNPTKVQEYEKLAQTEFEKVVMLDPQRELAPRNYSPKVIQIFERIRQKLIANNRITVSIDANVPQAKVFINGKLIGPTPIKARLIPGEYYVLVERKGMKSWSQLAKLRNTVEHLTADLRSASENADWNGLFQIHEGTDQQTADMTEITNMSRALGGEIVVLCNLDQVDNHVRLLGQLYDTRTQEYSQVAISDVGPSSPDHSRPIPNVEPAAYDLAKGLAGMIRPDGYLINSGQKLLGDDPSRIAPDQPQAIQTHEAPPTKLYEHWWFWTGIVAIGVGGYFAIQHFGGTSGSDIAVDNSGNFK